MSHYNRCTLANIWTGRSASGCWILSISRPMAEGLADWAHTCNMFDPIASEGLRRSITSATPTGEPRQHGLIPVEPHRLQGILYARNLPLRFDTSLLFAPSDKETSMTKATRCPSVPDPPLRWIQCKSMTTSFTNTTSMPQGTRGRSLPSIRKSRAQTKDLGC